MGGVLSEKKAELTNTYDMPWSPTDTSKNTVGKEKAVIKKSSVMTDDEILKQAFRVVSVDAVEETKTASALTPSVDVSGKEAPKSLSYKTASRYALPLLGMYPLDTYGQVKQASAYFDEWHVHMSPSMRREYCHNLVKRASDLSMPVGALAARYGSDRYASKEQLKIAMDMRRSVLKSDADKEVLDKLAEAQHGMLPEDFAATLGEFDNATGLNEFYGGGVPDNFHSTFQKSASAVVHETETDPKDAVLVGNEYLPHRDLVSFARRGGTLLTRRFGEDFTQEFAKDPSGIFDSLPRDQKLVIMRMASAGNSTDMSASKS